LLREVKTHKQRIFTRRDLLVRELREIARDLEGYEQGKWSMGHIQMTLKTERWHQTASEWSVLRSSNKELWNEIADAYEAIELTRTTSADPPASGHFLTLAERLNEAKL
jgi:hypothetical protein